MTSKYFKRTQGFTLVELSIVIIIIGFLIAGVAAGQSLIKQAALNSVITEYGGIRLSVNTFKERYGFFPGDFPNAYAYWGAPCGADTVGAKESCNGNGDGLFSTDRQITGNDVIEALKVNGPPDYADDVQREIESTDDDDLGLSEDEGSWDDDLVPAAINVIRSSKRASTSMLQRRLKIGYNRAARIMELLEDEGIVGPENGQNPREILKDLDMVS